MNFFILTHSIIALVLLITWIVRIFLLKQNQVLLVTISLLIPITFYFCGVREHQLNPTLPRNMQVKVFPEEIKVNGNSLSFVGINADKTPVSVRYKIPSANSQKFFLHNKKTLLINMSGEFLPVSHITNHGSFDYGRYLKQHENIHYELNAKKITTINVASFSVINWLHEFKKEALDRMNKLPPRVRYHGKSLLLGENDPDFKADRNILSILGLIHLFSISGLHIFTLCVVLRFIFRLFKITKESSDCILLILLPVFGILVGGSDSTQRAVGILIFGIIVQKLKLPFSGIDRLMLLLGFNLMVTPYLLHSLGGILTYLMAAVLLFVKDKSFFTRAICMNLISLPIILRFIFQWHLLTVGLNILLIPVFSWVILPATVIGVSVGYFVNWIAQLMELVLNIFYYILEKVAKIPGLSITYGQISGLLVIILLWIGARIIWQGRKRYYGGYAAFLVIGYCIIHFPMSGKVIMIDVGQGDSILVQTPWNKSVVLIDTGGKVEFQQQGWQQRRKSDFRPATATINYLKSVGISKLDSIILSHQDTDHIGDLEYILKNIAVKEIVFPAGMTHTTKFTSQIQDYLSKIRLHPALRGDILEYHNLRFKVLHPNEVSRATNADSLTVYSQIGGYYWLFTGDLEQAGERTIMDQGLQKVDILKIGHHGSDTSSDPTFLQQIKPKLALISAGRRNRYGHPAPAVIQRLKENNIPFLVTAEQGMITYRYSAFGKKFSTYMKGERIYGQ